MLKRKLGKIKKKEKIQRLKEENSKTKNIRSIKDKNGI